MGTTTSGLYLVRPVSTEWWSSMAARRYPAAHMSSTSETLPERRSRWRKWSRWGLGTRHRKRFVIFPFTLISVQIVVNNTGYSNNRNWRCLEVATIKWIAIGKTDYKLLRFSGSVVNTLFYVHEELIINDFLMSTLCNLRQHFLALSVIHIVPLVLGWCSYWGPRRSRRNLCFCSRRGWKTRAFNTDPWTRWLIPREVQSHVLRDVVKYLCHLVWLIKSHYFPEFFMIQTWVVVNLLKPYSKRWS